MAPLCSLASLTVSPGPNNTAVTEGPHADEFRKRLGKTHFVGQMIPSGHIWRAKGEVMCSVAAIFLTMHAPDYISKSLIERAQEIITPYQDSTKGPPPHPSFVLQLPDEVYLGSNLFAFQKSFDGPFHFDIFFESASSKQKLSCTSSVCLDSTLFT